MRRAEQAEVTVLKPRLVIKHRWHDAGWPYEWWECRSEDGTRGVGSSAELAYEDWLAKGKK